MNNLGVIHTKSGHFTIVDADLHEFLNSMKWGVTSEGYFARKTPDGKAMYLHRLINGTPDGFHTDHVNRYKQDNTRSNLRTATVGANLNNSKQRSDAASSKFKGVAGGINSKANPWKAMIRANGKQIHLGCFPTEEAAYGAYQEASLKYYGTPHL